MGQATLFWVKGQITTVSVPEMWLNAQFIHRLNDYADVMTENLTKRLVDLSRFGFAPQGNPELGFDHGKSSRR